MSEPIAWDRLEGTEAAQSGRLSGVTHIYPVRVFYEDTDAAGIVYYANYLKFVERARTEMMRLAGVSHSGLLEAAGIAFIVRRCTIDYRLPARLDDLIEVHTRILSLGGASIDAEQIVMRDGDRLVTVMLRLGCVDRSGRPKRMPAPARAALRGLISRAQPATER